MKSVDNNKCIQQLFIHHDVTTVPYYDVPRYCVDVDEKEVDITKLKPNTRVCLKADTYMLHRVLPSKVDPLVSLMKVEKVPDSTYEMVGGLDKQVGESSE